MKGIIAMALNRVIGDGNKLPWDIPEEINWFKKYTTGKHVLVGRKTYESFGKLYLKNRKLIVLGKKYNISPNCFFNLYYDRSTNTSVKLTSDWKSVFDSKNMSHDNIIVAGGLKIYKLYMPYIDEFFVSYILDQYEGNIKMFDFECYFNTSSVVYEHKNFWVVKYTKSQQADRVDNYS